MGAMEDEPLKVNVIGGQGRDFNESAEWRHDAALRVRFYFNHQSRHDHVRIEIPVDEKTVIDRMASAYDKRRFAAKWAAYEEARDQHSDETPLEDALWMDQGMVPGLERQRVFTVEQLAALPDGALKPGIRALRERAREELAKAEKALEKSGRDEEMHALFAKQQAEISELRAQLEAAQKPKRAQAK